jgi:hypothetical protein
MRELDRASAYEAINCSMDILDRLKCRNLPPDIWKLVYSARVKLSEIGAELHRLIGPLRDGGRVMGGYDLGGEG